jgi:hypothetical protein
MKRNLPGPEGLAGEGLYAPRAANAAVGSTQTGSYVLIED